MPKSKIGQVLKQQGMAESLEHPFFKSRRISGYLNMKRIEYRIDTLGPRQQAHLAEIIDISTARLPEPVPIPVTLNNIVRCMEKHEEIRNFVPIHVIVSAQDIEPKSATFFMVIIDGSIAGIEDMPRRKRKRFADGEYKDTGTEIPATTLNLQNYIDSFWLGHWPSGRWLDARAFRLPWKRIKMFKTENCHMLSIDDEALRQQSELEYPYFSGEIMQYPIMVPNIDYDSAEFCFQSSDEIMAHLGLRRPYKYEIVIRRVTLAVSFMIMIIVFFLFEEHMEEFVEKVARNLGLNTP